MPDDLSTRMNNWRAYAMNSSFNPCIGFRTPTPAKHWQCKASENVPADYYQHVPFDDEVIKHGCPIGEKPVGELGDSVLFNALLGWSGETLGREAVGASQDETGRWWRSPLHGTHVSGTASFSKDHTLGVLLYLITTPDKDRARAQAKQWLHYMRKNQRIQDRLKIGRDIPEPLGLHAARHLRKCNQGIFEDGCIIHDTIDRVVYVWKKLNLGHQCVVDPDSCLKKVAANVKADVPTEIAYWTNNVCPEPEIGHCTITPGLWFLFHRVWRDYLGLAPSASMRFADGLFNDESYDLFVAWSADSITEKSKYFQVHLAAVNGLIRALLGKPATVTITTVHGKRPENPFFQYLMHKYVNNHMYPTEEIRDYLLAISPKEIPEVKTDIARYEDATDGDARQELEKYADKTRVRTVVTGRIGAADPHEIDGDQWAWERYDVKDAVRHSMGWDCIFIGNLLVQEFQVELDYYKQNVLPDLLRDRKQALNQALGRLAESYAPVQRIEADLDEFVEKAVALIQHPEVTFDELQWMNNQIEFRHRNTCPLSLQQLWEDYRVAQEAYQAFLRLKEESRRKFQDAERLSEFGDIWNPQMVPYADTEAHLDEVALRLGGKTACLKLLQLLAAIPLRIEREKINGTNANLRAVSNEIVADLKQTAKDLEYDRVKTELNERAAQLAEPLRHHRIRRRYENATQVAEEISDRFELQYRRLADEASLLGEDELAEIRQDAVQIIERENQEWQDFVAEFGLKQIVLGRLNVLNAKAKRQYEQIQTYPQGHQRALYFQWRLRAQEAGYPPTRACRNAGRNAYRQLSCWQFQAPNDMAPHDEWVLFDVTLNGIEQLIADFSTIGPPADIERAEDLERRQLPETGVVFDVEAQGACTERIQTPEGIRYRGCQIPQRKEYLAAAVSPSGGNGVIESLTFFNRLVIRSTVESLYRFSTTWKLNRSYGNVAVDTDVPVPYAGAVLEIETEDEWPGGNVFKPGSKIEVQINYMYPDVRALRVYASTLGKYTKFMARVHRDLAPGSTQVEVIASLDEGIEQLDLLLDRGDLDAITRRQIENAKTRMRDGKASITQACSSGGPQLCSAQIRTVRESLSTNIEDATRELTSLRQFLTAEIQRLTGIADTIRRQLQDILDDLTPPERIAGIQPFLVWMPTDEVLEDASDDQIRFIRGELVRYEEQNASLFTNLRPNSSYDGQTIGDDYTYWAWSGHRECGRGSFGGIRDDMALSGRSRGPTFNNESCSTPEKRHVSVIYRRQLVSNEQLNQLIASRRTILVNITVEYATRAAHLAHQRRHSQCSLSVGLTVSRVLGSGFPICGEDVPQHPDHDAWFEGKISTDCTINFSDQRLHGFGLFFELDIFAREVQVNSLRWLLLNPF